MDNYIRSLIKLDSVQKFYDLRNYNVRDLNFISLGKSCRGKKLRVVFDTHDRLYEVHFSNPEKRHFRDKTNHFSHMDHNNSDRRMIYLQKRVNHRDKEGCLTANNPFTPNFWTLRLLY